jgi:hypothetical protein
MSCLPFVIMIDFRNEGFRRCLCHNHDYEEKQTNVSLISTSCRSNKKLCNNKRMNEWMCMNKLFKLLNRKNELFTFCNHDRLQKCRFSKVSWTHYYFFLLLCSCSYFCSSPSTHSFNSDIRTPVCVKTGSVREVSGF